MFDLSDEKSTYAIPIAMAKDIDDEEKEDTKKSAAGLSATASARVTTKQASQTFAKPEQYTGNRKLYDSGTAKRDLKLKSFANDTTVKDPYTGDVLELRKAIAKAKYGADWQKHLAEVDHITSIEKVFKSNSKNPWLKNDDIRDIANSDDNLQIVSRKFNNAKRSRTNKEFVENDDYLQKTGVEIKQGKQNAIKAGEKSQAAISKSVRKTSLQNAFKTGHEAGKYAAQSAGSISFVMSGTENLIAVIKGEKNAKDALRDTVIDTGRGAATGYLMGGGLTVISQTLSSSTSKFVQALSASSVPGKVITAVMVTGNTLKRYGNGEISTQECLIEIGEKGLNFAATSYAMVVGQALIPIPVIGAAVGALVGSVIYSKLYSGLINALEAKELEHQERQRMIAECKAVAAKARAYKKELESYLASYFKEYQNCFDEALSEIQCAFQAGDADGMIVGVNQITRKLGGRVYYETVDEFKRFLDDDSIDVL